MSTLFISHSAPDYEIAEALECAIRELTANSVNPIKISYSSSAKNGPQGGEEWREWIEQQIVEATTVLIVLSRESVTRHWPIWEAAACRGVALQRQLESESNEPITPRIIALTYGITDEECPDPFKKEQIFSGVNYEEMDEAFTQILEYHEMETRVIKSAGSIMEAVFDNYLSKVEQILLSTPSLVTEASVQDWLRRLDKLVEDKRWTELVSYQHWMDIAFGHDSKEKMLRQIDLRLHRRLGDYYLEQNNFKKAIEQLQLARESAPRDIYVLSRLTESLIKQILKNENKESVKELQESIEALLKRIRDLDPEVWIANADSAALAAKYERRIKNNPNQAIEIYKQALKYTPNSYYLADVLGQTQIETLKIDDAKETYKKVITILDQLSVHSIWSVATKATANMVLGNFHLVEEAIDEIIKFDPSPSQNQLMSIKSGIKDIGEKMVIDENVLNKLLDKMDG